jgi:predicted peptidase
MTQTVHVFESSVYGAIHLKYLLYLPHDYGIDVAKKWPLILFLHGIGERGDDPEHVKRHGIPRIVETRDDFPFIVVSPQCPSDTWWPSETKSLSGLLDEVIETYAVDESRIYLTGMSMGGYGAWQLAITYPKRFAALAPVCGGGDTDAVCALKDMPVWAFHGAQDVRVPLEESERMVEALRECGGNVRLTVYPDLAHDSWTRTYEDPALYEWFLNQT